MRYNIVPGSYKKYIINLSSLHTLHLASLPAFLSQGTSHPALRAFVSLSYKYSEISWSCCRSRFFTTLSHLSWVIAMFMQHGALINAYKMGRSVRMRGELINVTTDVFLEEMLRIFGFLNDADFMDDDIRRIYDKKDFLFSLRGIPNISDMRYEDFVLAIDGNKSKIAKALLEEAWNSIIDFTAADTEKWRILQNLSQDGTPIYLISNSNELNVLAILSKLLESGCISRMPDSMIASPDGPSIIQIPDTQIFLCLSFNFGCFKADGATGTPGIIRKLVDDFDIGVCDVEFISQFAGDLHEAEAIGTPPNQLHRAEDFFAHQSNFEPSEYGSLSLGT